MNKSIPLIAFDLHGVVFRLDWLQIIRLFWDYPHKMRLVFCGLDPRMARHGLTLLRNHPTDEEVYALFERYHPIVLPFIIECTHTQKPIAETVALLHACKAKGYRLHILSNIGPRRFAELKQRFGRIIGLFDGAQITNGNVRDMIKKPQKRFFDAYFNKYGNQHEQKFFIDDSKSNLKAASEAGFTPIRFKNPRQLAEQLKKHGV